MQTGQWENIEYLLKGPLAKTHSIQTSYIYCTHENMHTSYWTVSFPCCSKATQ